MEKMSTVVRDRRLSLIRVVASAKEAASHDQEPTNHRRTADLLGVC